MASILSPVTFAFPRFKRHFSHATMATNQSDYFLESEEEINRLANQHNIIKDEMGSLVLAPIDLSMPLRILDSGTADGRVVGSYHAPCGHCASEADTAISRHLDSRPGRIYSACRAPGRGHRRRPLELPCQSCFWTGLCRARHQQALA